jgi:hypothetical protein
MVSKRTLYIISALFGIGGLYFIIKSLKNKSASIEPITETAPTVVHTSDFKNPQTVLTRLGTRIRADHNTKSDVLKTYQNIVELTVLDSAEQSYPNDFINPPAYILWYNVIDPNGLKGWVRSDVVDTKI